MLKITVLKWDDYNPRNDQKRASWFRFDNRFPIDPKFFNYSNDQKMVWVYILSECSVAMKASVSFDANLCGALLRVSPQLVSDTIGDFEKIGLIAVKTATNELPEPPEEETVCTGREQQDESSCTGREQITDPNKSGRYERTNERDVTNKPPLPPKGGQEGRKEKDAFADLTLATALGCIRDNASEEDAKRKIGPRGWELLLFEFRTWDAFVSRTRENFKSGFGDRFRSQTLATMKNIARLSNAKARGAQLVAVPNPEERDIFGNSYAEALQ